MGVGEHEMRAVVSARLARRRRAYCTDADEAFRGRRPGLSLGDGRRHRVRRNMLVIIGLEVLFWALIVLLVGAVVEAIISPLLA